MEIQSKRNCFDSLFSLYSNFTVQALDILVLCNSTYQLKTKVFYRLWDSVSDEKGCAPNCATVSETGELILALGPGLKYYNVEQKTQEEYPVAGEKFQIVSQGAYVAVLVKEHQLKENTFKVAVFNPQDKLNIYSGHFENAKAITFQVCLIIATLIRRF